MTIWKSIGCRFKEHASLVWKSPTIAGFHLPSRAIRKLCEPSHFFVIKYMAAAVNSMCMNSSLRAKEAMYRLPWPCVRRSVDPCQGHYRSTSVWRRVRTWTVSVLWGNITAIFMIKGIECHQPTKCFPKKMFSFVRGCLVLASAIIDWTIIGFYNQINLYEGKSFF